MRTTLTLDPDVALLLKKKTAERHATIKQVVNEALRRGLRAEPKSPRKPFRVIPWSSGLLPGIDPTKLNQLADEIDDQKFLEVLERSRRAKRG